MNQLCLTQVEEVASVPEEKTVNILNISSSSFFSRKFGFSGGKKNQTTRMNTFSHANAIQFSIRDLDSGQRFVHGNTSFRT